MLAEKLKNIFAEKAQQSMYDKEYVNKSPIFLGDDYRKYRNPSPPAFKNEMTNINPSFCERTSQFRSRNSPKFYRHQNNLPIAYTKDKQNTRKEILQAFSKQEKGEDKNLYLNSFLKRIRNNLSPSSIEKMEKRKYESSASQNDKKRKYKIRPLVLTKGGSKPYLSSSEPRQKRYENRSTTLSKYKYTQNRGNSNNFSVHSNGEKHDNKDSLTIISTQRNYEKNSPISRPKKKVSNREEQSNKLKSKSKSRTQSPESGLRKKLFTVHSDVAISDSLETMDSNKEDCHRRKSTIPSNPDISYCSDNYIQSRSPTSDLRYVHYPLRNSDTYSDESEYDNSLQFLKKNLNRRLYSKCKEAEKSSRSIDENGKNSMEFSCDESNSSRTKKYQNDILKHLKTYFQSIPLNKAIEEDHNKMAYPRSIMHELNTKESKIVWKFLMLSDERVTLESRHKLVQEKKALFTKLNGLHDSNII